MTFSWFWTPRKWNVPALKENKRKQRFGVKLTQDKGRWFEWSPVFGLCFVARLSSLLGTEYRRSFGEKFSKATISFSRLPKGAPPTPPQSLSFVVVVVWSSPSQREWRWRWYGIAFFRWGVEATDLRRFVMESEKCFFIRNILSQAKWKLILGTQSG